MKNMVRKGLAAALLAFLLPAPALADEGILDAKATPAAAKALAAKAEKGGARVIVMLSAPSSAKTAPSGAVPLDEYIDGLQTRTLQSLGWVNLNDIIRFEFTPAMAMPVDGARLKQLMESDTIAGIYEDKINKAYLAESVPLIGGPALHAAGATGKGTAVAILDTGIDSSHPFLRGKVVAEGCFSTPSGPGTKSFCPGGGNTETGAGSARPCPLDDCRHGTHVAGIVAGKGNDFTGVAPDADLIGAQVFTAHTLSDGRSTTGASTSDIIRALEWVYSLRTKHRIAAVNMSLGGGQFKRACDSEAQPYAPIFKLLHDAGIAVVVAAGNEGFTDALAAPACLSQAVSVGASDKEDRVAVFSNSASFLSLLAPGIDVGIGNLQDHGINSSIPGGHFARMPGTSMAAPHVAGAFAALRSLKPDAGVNQLLGVLRQAGKEVRDTRNGIAVSRISIDRALAMMQRPGAPPTPPPIGRAPEPKKPIPAPREGKPRPPTPIPGDDDGIGKW